MSKSSAILFFFCGVCGLWPYIHTYMHAYRFLSSKSREGRKEGRKETKALGKSFSFAMIKDLKPKIFAEAAYIHKAQAPRFFIIEITNHHHHHHKLHKRQDQMTQSSHRKATTHGAPVPVSNLPLPICPLGRLTPLSSSTTRSPHAGAVGGQIMYRTGLLTLKTRTSSLSRKLGNGNGGRAGECER